MQNIVRVTPPAPVVAGSAEEALDVVFKNLVVDPSARSFRFQKKHRAIGKTRRAYQDHHVPDEAITVRGQVTSGPYVKSFDFAVSNGRVVQLVQCWSFQLPNQADLAEEVKAWAWIVHELVTQGGFLRVGERNLEIPAGRAIDMASVYVPPFEGQPDTHAFDEAQAAFKEVGVPGLPADDADQVGERAAALLAE